MVEEFIAPRILWRGEGSLGDVPDLIRSRISPRPISVVTIVDDVVLKKGLVSPLLERLSAEGYRVTLVSDLGAEPDQHRINLAAERARSSAAELVIGVGGGSVLDTSKIIALLLRNEGRAENFTGPVDPSGGVAPLILAPTTCGTGAEATNIAMMSVDGAKRIISCQDFIPEVAVLDDGLIESLPPQVVAATGMDALAHAVESIMSTKASTASEHHAERAIRTLIANLPQAVEHPGSARSNCLWASHLAGQALNAGVVVGHSIGYCLAREASVSHGISSAVSLPYCIAYNRTMPTHRARMIARAVTLDRSDDLNTAALQIQDLCTEMGLPTRGEDLGVSADRAPDLAQICADEYPRPTNPVPLDPRRLTDLFRALSTGDLEEAFA